jgi:restriction system protein
MIEKKVKSDQLGKLRIVKASTEEELAEKIGDLEQSWKDEFVDAGPTEDRYWRKRSYGFHADRPKHACWPLFPSAPQTVEYTPFDAVAVLPDTGHETGLDDATNYDVGEILPARSIGVRVLEALLAETALVDDRLDWKALLDTGHYPVPKPSFPKPPDAPKLALEVLPDLSAKPTLGDFRPTVHWWEKLLLFPWLAKIKESWNQYLAARKRWKQGRRDLPKVRAKVEKKNRKKHQVYDDEYAYWAERKNSFDAACEAATARWDEDRLKYETARDADMKRLASLKKRYFDRVPSAIIDYCRVVLNRSRFPAVFPRKIDIAFDDENGIMVVDYQLPNLDEVEILKNVGKEREPKYRPLSQRDKRRVHDDTLYSIALRTLHELVEADGIGAIKSLVFNGWVRFTDKTSGKRRNEFILSVHATREQVEALNIGAVGPKECFTALKGISGSPRLADCVPVALILAIDRKDRRIVQGREVTDALAEHTNLAAMDWDDFEHLIRELFEKEFGASGAEVKVTQSSRDRGVDALVFDPDPLRGGKFVIQAKRYSNVVDVGAVRDLYGTVVNEGANRGILVTTSTYGPDAYEFAKDKPITLLRGSELLHLLEKHGYKFRIDLKEARTLLAGRPRIS